MKKSFVFVGIVLAAFFVLAVSSQPALAKKCGLTKKAEAPAAAAPDEAVEAEPVE